MSKTYRRTDRYGKSAKWLHKGDVVSVHKGTGYTSKVWGGVWQADYWANRYEVRILEGKLLAMVDAKFHSDATRTMRNAPKWYRQSHNRKLRREQNAHLAECSRYEDGFEHLTMPKFIKDAGWYW